MAIISATYLSPIASCINLAATVLSTPPLTAPTTLRTADFPDSFYLLPNVFFHGPFGLAATYVKDEPCNDFLSSRGVRYFRVELYSIEWLRIVCYRSERGRCCTADNMKIRWYV